MSHLSNNVNKKFESFLIMNKTVCKNLSNVLPTKKRLQVIEMPGAASTHYSLPVN